MTFTPHAWHAASFAYGARRLPFRVRYQFPERRFTATPLVLARSGPGGLPIVELAHEQASRDSVTLCFYGADTEHAWCQGDLLAIQMTPGSSAR